MSSKEDRFNTFLERYADGERFEFAPPVRPAQEQRAILRMLRDALPPEVWEHLLKKHDPARRQPRDIDPNYQGQKRIYPRSVGESLIITEANEEIPSQKAKDH